MLPGGGEWSEKDNAKVKKADKRFLKKWLCSVGEQISKYTYCVLCHQLVFFFSRGFRTKAAVVRYSKGEMTQSDESLMYIGAIEIMVLSDPPKNFEMFSVYS